MTLIPEPIRQEMARAAAAVSPGAGWQTFVAMMRVADKHGFKLVRLDDARIRSLVEYLTPQQRAALRWLPDPPALGRRLCVPGAPTYGTMETLVAKGLVEQPMRQVAMHRLTASGVEARNLLAEMEA